MTEDRKRLKQHIKMIVDHKTPVEELEDINRKLRLELHTLRFKEAQEQRFIWWVWNVYSRNVCDLIYAIMGATTYDTEGEAKEGKYALPKHCFDLMKRIDEYTEHIYDGTYLDVEISKDAKQCRKWNNGGGEVSDINFEVPGIPVAKQSTRFTTKGKRPHAYPDKNVDDWQTTVCQYAIVARTDHSWAMTRKPVAVKLVFRLPDRRKRDIDNLEKCVLDGLKGVLFEDDDQVVQVTKRKIINKDHPGVTIIVELDNPVEDCE